MHKDNRLIGSRNWMNFEISKSKELGKKLVAVKLNRLNRSPLALFGANASWAMSFTQPAIMMALIEA